MRRVVAAVAAVLVSGCGGAFTSRVDSVARAGEYELGVQRLAEVIAAGKELPVRRDVVTGIAVLWVDYTTFADRLLAGDSLLDSAHVAAAMWAELEQEVASRFHDRLIGEAARLDSSAVDSLYAVGDYRLIKHVTFPVSPDASPNIRQTQRAIAEDTRAKLVSGRLTWAQVSGDTARGAKGRTEGDLGVIARGETVERFENVAFALAPGEISAVTETPGGYDIIFRPPLAAVRADFAAGAERRREDEFDERYLDSLPQRWNLRVRTGIGPAVREVGRDPVQAKQSGKILGSYKGGQFRVSDLSRWLQAMPPEVWQGLPGASDSQIVAIVQHLMRNEVLLREAKAAGVTVPPEYFQGVTDSLHRQLALLGALIGLPNDSLPTYRALPAAARRDLVQVRVLGFLEAVAQNRRRLQLVPAALADRLRTEVRWKVEPAGVERVLERARQIRLALDTVAPARPPAAPPITQPPGPRPPGSAPPGQP
jgi:hypothetical protein